MTSSLFLLQGFEPKPTTRRLPFEVCELIFAAVDDIHTLARCARISRAFWDAATPSLYRTLIVKESSSTGTGNDSAFIAIHAHPHLRVYVRTVIHEGSISHDERSPSGLRWRTQLPLFPNLTAYSFTPLSPLKLLSSIRFFTALVDVLLQCRSLTDVAWHFSVTSIIAPIILRLTQVRNLTIDCLTATALLEWHNHIDLVNKLEGLHILNLEKLIPQHTPALSRSMSNLTRLTLGKHPWVSSSHLLTLLEGTPHLQHLDVHIDDYGPGSQAHSKAIDSLNGLGTSSTSIRNPGSEFTGLPQLKALVVRHNSISAELHFSRFLACIDTLAWKSELQSLEIDSAHGACTFNTTIAYLFAKHPTLRSFVASHIRVFSHEFLTVLNICPLLEYASFLAEKACVQRLLSLSKNPTDSSFRGELEISGNWKLSTLKWRQR